MQLGYKIIMMIAKRYYASLWLLLVGAMLWALPARAESFWGSTDMRYGFRATSMAQGDKHLVLRGWRGETLSAQLLVVNRSEPEALYRVETTPLKGRRARIEPTALELGWVDEVLADTFSHCGKHELEAHGRIKQADRIVLKPHFLLPTGQQRGVWLSIKVPEAVPAGSYRGRVRVSRSGRVVEELSLTIEVSPRVLPSPRQWRYHLDFWQNPYAIARWHGVEPWSDAHLEAMRPYMMRLADAGQKVVTATLINRPWDGQTYDAFGSMIKWIRHSSGQWSYDFSIFDRWVRFMESCGIDREITCFSMIPWKLSFEYYDEASATYTHWSGAPGEAIYNERWGHFLEAFARHLAEQGWLTRTTIAMDERSLEQMQQAIALIHQHAPGLKISMAGYYHPEIEAHLYDYCIDEQSPEQYPEQVLARRRAEGKISTYYTCCSTRSPNTFTFSPPAEASFISWYALRRGLDGYLRWAYNSWPIDPEYDSRFTAWSAGDTFIIYPEAYPSIRWARLVEGIQQYEKYHILRQEAERTGDTALMQSLERILDMIDVRRIATDVATMTSSAQAALNRL